MQASTFPVTKPSVRSLFVGVAIAVFFMLTLVALAEDKTPPPAAPAPTATPANVAPASAPAAEAPVPTAPPVPEMNGQPAPAAVTPPTEAPALRRIDEQVEKSDRTPPPAKKKSRSQNIKDRVENAKKRSAERDAARSDRAVVNVFADSNLAAGEKADQVVAVFGSATSDGEVADQVIAVFGNTRVTGPVLGQVVTVFGNSTINSHVSEQVVVVLGNLELGPNAQIDSEVICVGGSVTRDTASVVKDGVKTIMGTKGMGLKTWFDTCFLRMRPLAFAPGLGWAWGLAFSFLAIYALGALLFRSGAEKCLKVLETRPGFSVLTALLTVLIAPVLIVILVTTGIGIVAVPFLGLALVCATLFGKMVVFAWVGRRFTKLLGDGPFAHIAVAVLVGGLVVMMLYTVPILGALLFKFTGWVGMGAVIYTIMLGMKREKPAVGAATPFAASGAAAAGAGSAAAYAPMHSGAATAVPVVPVVVTEAVTPMAAVPTDVPLVSSGFVGAAAMPAAPAPEPNANEPVAVPPVNAAVPPIATPPPMRSFYPPQPVPPPIHSASSLPRAGFWVRLAAMGIDGILIGVITGVMVHGGPLMLPGLAAYAACMWYYKGTTIGGIICGLKVVRIDDRPLDWPTSIVRALGCFLSMAIMGLGFIWVVFDPERQSWHDKIAGTTVVRMPKGVSLL